MRLFSLTVLALCQLLCGTWALAASEARTDQVRLQLLFAEPTRDDRLWAALRFELIPHWHVYWRNPGDSGEPPRFDFELPTGWQAGEVRWPVPDRIPVGPLVNYGYEHEVVFMVPLERIDAAAAMPTSIAVDARWLVCEKACIPQQARLEAQPADSRMDSARLERAKAEWPATIAMNADYEVADGLLNLRVSGLGWSADTLRDLWFAANEWGAVAPNGEQRWQLVDGDLNMQMPVGDIPPDGRAALGGLLVLAEQSGDQSIRRGFALEARPGFGAVSRKAATVESVGLLTAILFAIVGGLILNLMPCVLPVLTMKVMSLTRQVHTESSTGPMASWRHGLAYGGGVLATVMILALVLIALRSGGEALGWGFQLQSPVVITLLAYLMLLIGLNLSGAFEVGGRLMGVGQGMTAGGGSRGDFMTGVLAVIVASPCTAPFMGVAMGFALTQPMAVALAVFAALGVGFALPMVLLSRWPALIRRIPRPGQWMVTFRQLLAFPMYATAAWLLWVLSQQVESTGLALAFAGALLLALAAWLWGLNGLRTRWLSLVPALMAVAVLTALIPASNPALESQQRTSGWSPEKVAQLRADGRPVFVNFTAAWCISCKVNEQVALSTDRVQASLQAHDVAYLKGDWTNRDPRIGEELARFDRAGVPLYLLYRPGEPEPVVLPQLLTEGIVLNALETL